MNQRIIALLIMTAMVALTGCHNNKTLAHSLQSPHKVIKASKKIATKAIVKTTKQVKAKKIKADAKKTATKSIPASKIKHALLQQYKVWKHVRYQLGGDSKRGIDCSGFTQITFKSQFNIELPHNTIAQAKKGKQISKKKLQIGDLVFFKTGRNVRHVGVYLGKQEFLHASTSKGVIISKLSNAYWSHRYWKAVRIAGI